MTGFAEPSRRDHGKAPGASPGICPKLGRGSPFWLRRGRPEHGASEQARHACRRGERRAFGSRAPVPAARVSRRRSRLDRGGRRRGAYRAGQLQCASASETLRRGGAERTAPGDLPRREFAKAGGLLVLGATLRTLRAGRADYVDRILRGANRDLPFQQPTSCELVVNLERQRHSGSMIPPSLLARADEVIE